ncbi:MAG: DUF692 family multinuclear iron-containing protein [Promethearchaeota archaeon]
MQKSFKIATPISQLFFNRKLSKKIITLSDVLELRDYQIKGDYNLPLIYHSELNILAKWDENDIKKLKLINKNYQITLVSYHILSRYQHNSVVNNKFVGSGKPLTKSEMEKNVKENIKISKDIFGINVPILLENMNHLLTDAYDIITNAEFINEIVNGNDCFLLFDFAHAQITIYNQKLNFKDYLNNLPLNKCKQIHFSRFSIRNGEGIDSHDKLKEDDWAKLKKLIQLIKSVEYITIEYYKSGRKLLNQLLKLKSLKYKS